MNSQASSMRHRAWPHALLESAVLSSALLLASTAAIASTAPAPHAAAAQPAAQPAPSDDVVKGLHQAQTYTITSPPTGPLMMDKPKLPDLSGYTQQAMQKKIVRSKAGKVSVRRMMQEDSLKEFIGGDNKMSEWVARQHGIPRRSSSTTAT
jgi:poly(beta-D-mannuronate) C5 epimerase